MYEMDGKCSTQGYNNANKILAGESYWTKELPILGTDKTKLLKRNLKKCFKNMGQ
jgi:hypothetical protein